MARYAFPRRAWERVETENTELALDEVVIQGNEGAEVCAMEQELDLQRIMRLIHRLKALDRQIMLLYLEDLDASSISDVTGLSVANVATKIHRIKKLLASQVYEGGETL